LELVRRAQRGDREAFEMLVERHAAEVYRLAAAIVGAGEARDLTQETFLRAWTKLPRLRDADAFTSWLRRICVNRCRNWLRSSRRRPSSSLDAADLGSQFADPNADFRIAADVRAVLGPAFDRLSPDQRAVLALHYSMGFSIAEAAQILDVRVGTAKSRLNAGLTVLRRAVGSPDGDAAPELMS
jgi:RNA polymerase sigma-70 factor, ECF subfamily